MNISLEIPRERYGLIVELAERMQAHRFGLGKTALQKLVYFLQVLYDVDCGYKFKLYTYGPFSSLLLSDLDSLDASNGVEVEYWGPVGYRIEPGPKSESVRRHAERFLGKYAEQIDDVVANFGALSAKQLELRATTVFVERAIKASGKAPAPRALTAAVRDLKPYFSEGEVKGAISELDSSGYIQPFKRPVAVRSTLKASAARPDSTSKGSQGSVKKGTSVHVALSAHSGRFVAKEAGTTKVQARPANQVATVSKANNTAKQNKSEVVTHGRDGTIRNKASYGNDPHPPRDKKH